MLPPRFRSLFAAAVVALGGLASATGASSTPSPFLPPEGGNEAAPTQDAPIELRGIMTVGDSVMFSIYDTATRTSSWTRLNQTGRDFVVRSYDQARDTVTVDHNGRSVTLALKTAKVASAPVAAPQPVVAQPGAVPQPVTGPVVLNPTPADEQRRLEAIAAEVNRRRQLRQQALQASRQAAGQPPQGLPPGATPPPQQR